MGCSECGAGHEAGEFGVQLVEFVVIFTRHRASFLEFAPLLGVALTPEMFLFKSDLIFLSLAHRPQLDFACTPGC